MRQCAFHAFLIIGLGICGCDERSTAKIVGSGVSKTDTRAVEDFDKVILRGEGMLELAVGPLEPLTVTADDNIVPIITTEVSDGTLTISFTESSIDARTSIVIRGSAPKITSVDCLGAGDIAVRNLVGEEIRLSVLGAGKVLAGGKADSLALTIKGAGSIDTLGLAADKVSVDIAGAGKAEVDAKKSLDVSIKGAASVRYTGDPQVKQEISGLGSVQKK